MLRWSVQAEQLLVSTGHSPDACPTAVGEVLGFVYLDYYVEADAASLRRQTGHQLGFSRATRSDQLLFYEVGSLVALNAARLEARALDRRDGNVISIENPNSPNLKPWMEQHAPLPA